ncbi:MAG: methyltransferase domain-containing protein [Nocardioidaceae bacterium]
MFVTVGMGPWPFDRLLSALGPVCRDHDVFAQTGTSQVRPDCPSAPFLPWADMQRRLAAADVVVTHAGNTVRLVQRLGKVPIAVAREAGRGEMRNDHQVDYLHRELPGGRVVMLDGDLRGLPAAVTRHPAVQRRLLTEAAALPEQDPAGLAALLDDQLATTSQSLGPNPFASHPLRRYAWAFHQLGGRTGVHLDLGCGDGAFAAALSEHTRLRVVAADAHGGYLSDARGRRPDDALVQVGGVLPFRDASIDSVSMLDSLEHVADESATLSEVHRVLAPAGLLIVTVPARHLFSVLDPDNAKFRLPRLHALVYRARYGEDRYRQRFVDDADGLRGDLAWTRDTHTNYDPRELFELIEAAGFRLQVRDGANLFWRLLQIPQLLLPSRVAPVLDPAIRLDGQVFARANLFLRATRE